MKQAALRKFAAMAVVAAALSSTGSALAQARTGQRMAATDAGPAGPRAPTVVLWDQAPDLLGYYSSDNYDSHDNFDNQGADDFRVPQAFFLTIQTVTARGFYDQSGSLVADSVLVEFYGNSANQVPGTLLRSEVIPGGSVGGLGTGEFVMSLGSPLVIGPGQYWLSVQANVAWDPPPTGNFRQWVWRESADPMHIDESVWRQPGDAYGSGCVDWAPRVTTCQRPSGSVHLDLSFRLDGTATALAETRFLPAIYR